MPYKDKQKQLECKRRSYAKHKRKYTTRFQQYYLKHRDKYKLSTEAKRKIWVKRYEIKLEVLSYYGKEGKAICCWSGCTVDDLDMLTLDHINNDGASEASGGYVFYFHVKKLGFPDGLQTLCCNHQWKKEMLRKRQQSGYFSTSELQTGKPD